MSIKDQIRAEIERLKKHYRTREEYGYGWKNALNAISKFLDTLPEQPESTITKSNALFDKCVENCDPAVMKEVSDKVDKMLASEGLEEAAEESWTEYEYRETPQGLYSSCYKDGFIAGAEWGMNQCPLPEDTTIFLKGVAEGRRLEREEQRPELVQHPAISYMYNADAGRGEQLKQAILALLKSDLIQVAGRRFTKTELIEWVETRPAEMEEDGK